MYKLIELFFFNALQNTDIKTFILIRTLFKLYSLTYFLTILNAYNPIGLEMLVIPNNSLIRNYFFLIINF